jgi:hypothetical protein
MTRRRPLKRRGARRAAQAIRLTGGRLGFVDLLPHHAQQDAADREDPDDRCERWQPGRRRKRFVRPWPDLL